MTDNALTVYQQFDTMSRAATALARSGYFADAKDEAQAVVKVMAGAELGLPPFAAMTGIHIIKGKPVLGANAIATLIQRHPAYGYRVKELSNEGCTIVFTEGGKVVGESSFTAADAKAAGLTVSDNWRKFPRNMFFARAISNGARWYCPAIFGGSPVYTPDEMDMAVDDTGDMIIEVTPVAVQAPQRTPELTSGNGNGNGSHPAPPPAASAGFLTKRKFMPSAAARLGVQIDEVRAYAKALGYSAVADDAAGRDEQFARIAKLHGYLVNNALPLDLAVSVVDQILTLEEAIAEMKAATEGEADALFS